MNSILLTALQSGWNSEIRRRGERYAASGKVRLKTIESDIVEASVQGTSRYEVLLLAPKPNVLQIGCTCPYFDDVGPCKHTWATVRAAMGSAGLRALNPQQPIQIQTEWSSLPAIPDPEAPGKDTFSTDPAFRNIAEPFPFASPSKTLTWRSFLETAHRHSHNPFAADSDPFSEKDAELLYILDIPSSKSLSSLILSLSHRFRKKNGEWSKLKAFPVDAAHLQQIPNKADQDIFVLLLGANAESDPYGYLSRANETRSRFTLLPHLTQRLLPLLAQTGRLFVQTEPEQLQGPLRLDLEHTYQLGIQLHASKKEKDYLAEGYLQSGAERVPLSQPLLLPPGGWVIWPDRLAPLHDKSDVPWIAQLRATGGFQVPKKQAVEFLKGLLALPSVPSLDLPPELHFEEIRNAPKPRILIRKPRHQWEQNLLHAKIQFLYGDVPCDATLPASGILLPEPLRCVVRDLKTEKIWLKQLDVQGFSHSSEPYGPDSYPLTLPARRLPATVRELLAAGWMVEAEGRLYRQAGTFTLGVQSRMDWFELHGSADFEGVNVQLPTLLRALSRGETTIALDDGSFGLLPEEWLQKYGSFATLGNPENDCIRFQKSQAGLLDALLAARPEVKCDELFQQVRRELDSFTRIEPADPEPGFKGTLRPYQREGLGWLLFLQRFGFGGCLADDMGLGKTVQVLALLESRRALRERLDPDDPARPGPSLVVMPRSLLFNWRKEAEHFSPRLRILEHAGIARIRGTDHLDDYDAIFTTYGTLRRDAVILRNAPLDYVILDESQAIKNAQTEGAKAVRLLNGRHRLAMSGTPIENHLGELWSLFEFLNPGMLGRASVFQAGLAAEANGEARALLSHALRPFILRRTKGQVASDLPEKTEETIHCELGADQRKLYNELRDYYRLALLTRASTDTELQRMKIQVLEALLRLRQAACHPALIDPKHTTVSSAKLDALLPQLLEVMEEGHKALVFSQFTSFLAIVRERLDEAGIPYEYLDGRTRDREGRVKRFQEDPECRLFLVSLKAGGVGLNLTAAEYVFLLDPWWNPAVEAQAIDRTHRIGQTRPVFAYRLIARDTVEERVLELQQTKRELADAILSEDKSLLRTLSRNDLEILLK